MIDQSTPYEVPMQTLAKLQYDEDSWGVIYVDNVNLDNGDVTYRVIRNHRRKKIVEHVCGEGHMRGLTFREFLLYKDPQTGRWKIGLNKATPIVFANIVIIAALVALVAYGAPSAWWLALMIAACVAVPLVTILGTLRNYRTQWR